MDRRPPGSNKKGCLWDYQGAKKRKRPLYTSARTALLPDIASLEELAQAAGVAAAEAIASQTPKPAVKLSLLCSRLLHGSHKISGRVSSETQQNEHRFEPRPP